MLTDLCVYTIKHSNDLQRTYERGGRGVFTEEKLWIKAKQLLDDAKEAGARLPIVFAPAEKTRYLFAWALLDDIVMREKTTTYRFSNLQLFSKRHRKSSLVNAKNGERLADGFIWPYAICRTPSFLNGGVNAASATRHYIAYHKIDERGPYHVRGRRIRHYSSHPRSKLERSFGQFVWVVSGERTKGRMIYKLCSVYQPNRIEPKGDEFKVIGIGKGFKPQIDITASDWLRDLLKDQSNFSLGFNQITNQRVIDALQRTEKRAVATQAVIRGPG